LQLTQNEKIFSPVFNTRVLEPDFSIERGELAATTKVRRTRAMQGHREHIDELYAGLE